MEFIFGTQLPTAVKFGIAFVLVLGLIGITALILKRFGSGRMPTSGGGRNRQPRLSVLDSAVVDAKRRLVLVRRDNSEHLLLIGGPTDVVVETNINRAGPQAPAMERRPRGMPQQDLDAIENALLPEPAYEEPAPQPHYAPRTPQPAPRMREREPARPQPESIDELPLAPALRPEPQPEPAAYSPPPPLPPRPVAHPSASAPQPAAPSPARGDNQYTDMQQKLEAALRKPAAAPAPRAPEPRVTPPPAPQPRPAPPMPQTRPMPASPAPAVSQPTVSRQPKQEAPNPFDSLEAEMASLLGQDKKR
jgi:flagellar protein FliO/FliZ